MSFGNIKIYLSYEILSIIIRSIRQQLKKIPHTDYYYILTNNKLLIITLFEYNYLVSDYYKNINGDNIIDIIKSNNISIYNNVGKCIHGSTELITDDNKINFDIMKMLLFDKTDKSLYERFIIIKEILNIKNIKIKLTFLENLLNKKYYFNIEISDDLYDKAIFNKLYLNSYKITIDTYDVLKEKYDLMHQQIHTEPVPKLKPEQIMKGGCLINNDYYYYKYMKYKIKYLKLIK